VLVQSCLPWRSDRQMLILVIVHCLSVHKMELSWDEYYLLQLLRPPLQYRQQLKNSECLKDKMEECQNCFMHLSSEHCIDHCCLSLRPHSHIHECEYESELTSTRKHEIQAYLSEAFTQRRVLHESELRAIPTRTSPFCTSRVFRQLVRVLP